MMYDLLIKNGMLIDGTGTKEYRADILIHDGKIVRIEAEIDESCKETIDARGLCVTPGFIDPHTHSDLALLRDRQHEHALTQGVTTVLSGLCGLGFAPMQQKHMDNYVRLSAGIFGNTPEDNYSWNSFGEYLERLDGCALNAMCAVSHNALRVAGVGFSSKKPDGAELEKMKTELRCAMKEGAVGLSTGLSYYPCAWSDTEELVELCKVVKEYDGIFLIHKRVPTVDPDFDDNAEVVEIARQTGVRTHVLHYKTGITSKGKPQSVIEPYQKTLDEGYDISFEFYPYNAGCGFGIVFLPPWAQEDGYYGIMEHLRDKSLYPRLKDDTTLYYDVYKPQDDAPCVFTHVKNHEDYEGLSFDEVARRRGQDVVDMILSVLLESDLEFGFRGSDPTDEAVSQALYGDMMSLIDNPFYTIGSDTIPIGSHPHPRMFGTFTRMLRMVREQGYPLEKYIHKITGFTANRLRLADRGILAEGKCADIAVFDFETVSDTADYENPRRCSRGVKYVVVNGKTAVCAGKVTGITAGKALTPD